MVAYVQSIAPNMLGKTALMQKSIFIVVFSAVLFGNVMYLDMCDDACNTQEKERKKEHNHKLRLTGPPMTFPSQKPTRTKPEHGC